MPHKVAQKCNFVHDFANNVGRQSKTYQASCSLSAIAELLVVTWVWDFQYMCVNEGDDMSSEQIHWVNILPVNVTATVFILSMFHSY